MSKKSKNKYKKAVYVRPHMRRNKKNKERHFVVGHYRRLGGSDMPASKGIKTTNKSRGKERVKEKELNKILEEHEKWLNDEGGQRAILRGVDLRHADLRDANLRYADLREADLRGADLRYTDLWDANLWKADLRDANLKGVNLRYADLWDAHLKGVNLRYADLKGANLKDAKRD